MGPKYSDCETGYYTSTDVKNRVFDKIPPVNGKYSYNYYKLMASVGFTPLVKFINL